MLLSHATRDTCAQVKTLTRRVDRSVVWKDSHLRRVHGSARARGQAIIILALFGRGGPRLLLGWQLKLNIKMALNCPFSEFSKSTSLAKRGVACRAPSAWGAHSACAGEYEQEKVRCCRSFCLVARAQTAKSRHLSGRLRAQRTRRERPQATNVLSGPVT